MVGKHSALAQRQQSVSIRCRVIDDITGEPVVRVRISLGGGKLADPVTRARGSSSGYPAIDVAAETPGDVDAGDIVLTRMRAISGRVTWENGDPADHVIAHALLVRRNRAEFRPGDALLSPANEHGDFRIGNLKPGRYVVYSYTMGMASESASDPIALPVFYPGSLSPRDWRRGRSQDHR